MSKTHLSQLGMGLAFTLLCIQNASAQWPNWRAKPVRQNIDLLPPPGDWLPRSYAAKYNRPSYLTGRIAYTIEPTSQEAMAWERAVQKGYYANHAPRMETHYMYPRAWEVLGVEPKPIRQASGQRTSPAVIVAEPVIPWLDDSDQEGSGDALEGPPPGNRVPNLELAPPVELSLPRPSR
jgi:hypothetical protein